MRGRLSDITNSQPQVKITLQETGDYLNRLVKENVSLVRLLEEKDKSIEISSCELRNLRQGIHKLQVQNWSLAQSNSQFLAEINLARNKVKALQHEVMCKNALLKAKSCPQQVPVFSGPVLHQNDEKTQQTSENKIKIADQELMKPSETNRRRLIRSKSLSASKTEKNKEKKLKSRRVRSSAEEVRENLFEIKDLQLTMPEEISNTPKKEEDEQEDSKANRLSIGRPLRRAAEKIQSYKEISLNAKMRRS